MWWEGRGHVRQFHSLYYTPLLHPSVGFFFFDGAGIDSSSVLQGLHVEMRNRTLHGWSLLVGWGTRAGEGGLQWNYTIPGGFHCPPPCDVPCKRMCEKNGHLSFKKIKNKIGLNFPCDKAQHILHSLFIGRHVKFPSRWGCFNPLASFYTRWKSRWNWSIRLIDSAQIKSYIILTNNRLSKYRCFYSKMITFTYQPRSWHRSWPAIVSLRRHHFMSGAVRSPNLRSPYQLRSILQVR